LVPVEILGDGIQEDRGYPGRRRFSLCGPRRDLVHGWAPFAARPEIVSKLRSRKFLAFSVTGFALEPILEGGDFGSVPDRRLAEPRPGEGRG